MAMYVLTYLEILPTTPASKKDRERPWGELITAYGGTKLTTRRRSDESRQFLMQQVSAHERLPAEASILGQNQLEVGTKGAIMSSAWWVSPRVEIVAPRQLGVTTAFFGIRRHHVFFRQRDQELRLYHLQLFAKNVKPCVVIYVYYYFFLLQTPPEWNLRHTKIIAATQRRSPREFFQGWRKWQFIEFKTQKRRRKQSGNKPQETFLGQFFLVQVDHLQGCVEMIRTHTDYSLLEMKNLDGVLTYIVLRT